MEIVGPMRSECVSFGFAEHIGEISIFLREMAKVRRGQKLGARG